MSKMYLMIGCPGAGKSYYIQQHIKPNELVISRDVIRFNILKKGDAYFSKENQVYNEFVAQINTAIAEDKTFYVDQTSLNPGSRSKLFSKLEKRPDKLIAIYIEASLEKVLYQNSLRSGRALVPEDAVINMYNSLVPPTKKEGFDEIWIIK